MQEARHFVEEVEQEFGQDDLFKRWCLVSAPLSFELKKYMHVLTQDSRWDVLSVLILHSNVRNRCWPGTETIAKMATNGTRARALRAKKWLLAHGAIEIVEYGKRVAGEENLPPRSHIYQLTGIIKLSQNELNGVKLAEDEKDTSEIQTFAYFYTAPDKDQKSQSETFESVRSELSKVSIQEDHKSEPKVFPESLSSPIEVVPDSSSSPIPKNITYLPRPHQEEEEEINQSHSQDSSGLEEKVTAPATTEEKQPPKSSAKIPPVTEQVKVNESAFDKVFGHLSIYYNHNEKKLTASVEDGLRDLFIYTGQNTDFLTDELKQIKISYGIKPWSYVSKTIMDHYNNPRPAPTCAPGPSTGTANVDDPTRYVKGKYAAFIDQDYDDGTEESA